MTTNGTCQELTGTGAAYIRVSTDQQDTERQYAAARSFEQRHGATIPKHHWFKDEGWARDKADVRPDFQRLMKAVEAGRVQWIVVDQLDRFGTKNAKQLITYLHRLDEAGCKLFDAAGKEWTGEDIGTIITAVVEGEKSRGEQTSKSHRVLGGKVEKARAGEWQGGPVRLGLNVACYSRETGKEQWRVVYEGRDRRLKVYPDGRSERFDGGNNYPQSQPLTEVLRVAPSRDKAEVAAAVSVFERYATEAISFTALAHHLNGLGFRSSFGGPFQGHHVGQMLADPIYIGYYTWNRTHHGKFNRHKGGQTVPELNYEEKVTRNDEADWVQSERLFEPLVGRKTWDAVQRKLRSRDKRAKAPKSPALYLAGLIYCGNCGGRMVAGPSRRANGRFHYYCGTYHKAARAKRLHESPCLRNAATQDVLEGYVARWLGEAGVRLEQLAAGPDPDHLTGRLDGQESVAWWAFRDGVARLTRYLAENHPDEYDAILRDDAARHEANEVEKRASAGSPGLPPGTLAARLGAKGRAAFERARRGEVAVTPDDFVAALLDCYRAHFDPEAVGAEVGRLEAEHTAMMRRYADLPTPRAREKAKAELAALETRITELEQQRGGLADLVAAHHREMLDLQQAVADAKLAMRTESGERALRRRAEAVRAVVQRIECEFTATGKLGGGPGKANARLAAVTIYPVTGDPARLPAGSDDVLQRTSVVSRW